MLHAPPVAAPPAGKPDHALPGAARGAQPGGGRDLRLDVFRGLAMFIILIAHTPDNIWTLWIPARFGWSDATEIFVFCSGMASAIAFGRVFERRGLAMGTARVGFRLWQVYWAHVGLFVALAATLAWLDNTGWFAKDYIATLNLHPFFRDPQMNLPAFLTLHYVPNYFDILPMYLVALAMMPAIVALHRVHGALALAAVLAMWAAAQFGLFAFGAEPWSERRWFFNPFGWQLIFFTGFAFMAGWLPRPPVRPALVWLAALVVIATVIPAYHWGRLLPDIPAAEMTGFQQARLWLHETTEPMRAAIAPLIFKSNFGLLRYVHFLALAYLAWVLAGDRGRRLLPRGDGRAARIWGAVLAAIMKVGQQSLAIFIFSMWYAQVQGVFLDQLGRSGWAYALVNVTGLLMLVAIAYGAGWFKSQPWKTRRSPG
ncbi:OpgC family protein [Mangrovicoccus algicola]|uniref:OpgC domain-containing protein n=1 Tax=Mangrovicoccus algicola TaxID=2771008 RepID=A0A8J6YXJ6_9RHOB|nr:OpgC domain-containing protein [Mangrovicoccus algicola]MBE3639547.1 OpgC domain-containing protein [Mangrovicoccus algicola]